jgi:hypothetical protein
VKSAVRRAISARDKCPPGLPTTYQQHTPTPNANACFMVTPNKPLMTDQYLAADERARDARRAGLQAKKEEQPLNTARSYASKQREWKVCT